MACGVDWDGIGAQWDAGAGLDFGYDDSSHELGFHIGSQEADFVSWSHDRSVSEEAINADILAAQIGGYK